MQGSIMDTMNEYTMDQIIHPESHLSLRECLSHLQQQIEELRKEVGLLKLSLDKKKTTGSKKQ